jgi:hypothetical protein
MQILGAVSASVKRLAADHLYAVRFDALSSGPEHGGEHASQPRIHRRVT